MNATIQTESLSKKYGSVQALKDLTFTVPAGAIYTLVGANGAGKTTIIKLLMNIYRPTSGRAQVLGIDSTRLAGAHFVRIGYVSENQELPEWMTVASLLDYLRPFYPQWDRSLERQLVRQFDLPLTRKLKHLSRGMRMKAAFASVLAYRPSLVVLDEPFSGLDPLVRDELIEGLLDRAPETTIFLSSHDLAEIESFASHVGYLEEGKMLFSEELSVLTDRFREVAVTFDVTSPMRTDLPVTWLRPEISGAVIRFIDSDFRGQRTALDLADIFPTARDVSFNPMSLRSIFLSIARSGRASETGAAEREVSQEEAEV
jgi:ABC-2 type transport system ATP-binding protein